MSVLFPEEKELHSALVNKGVDWRNQNKFQASKPNMSSIKCNIKVYKTAEIGA